MYSKLPQWSVYHDRGEYLYEFKVSSVISKIFTLMELMENPETWRRFGTSIARSILIIIDEDLYIVIFNY